MKPTDLWARGKPKFDTVRVELKKCPLNEKLVLDLATAAWYEAYEMPVTTTGLGE